MKYSVIIPAYQAENTISRCLDSLLAGIRDDVEILIVNDGSTDRTAEICLDYASRCPGIRCFTQAHGGVSAARNLALDHALGEFITFVDSDDYVLEEYFRTIDAHISDDTDFLMFGKSVFDGSILRSYPFCDRRTDNPRKTVKILCKALIGQKLNALFTKVFRRSVLLEHGIRFDERLQIGEDKVFVVQYMSHVRKAVFIRDALYIMSVENDNSLSRKRRENLCDHILLEHQLLFETVELSGCHRILKKAVSFSYHRSAYTVIRELRKFEYSRTRRLQETLTICRRYAQKKDLSYYSLHHWLISLPIRLKMARLIDFVLRRKWPK